jgi:hypothetical protein
MKTAFSTFGAAKVSLILLASASAGDLAPPVQIQAGGRAIDVDLVGHAAPFLGDIDGDGLKDLLVGQFEEGRLRIYRNVGTSAEPRFDKHRWFEAGGAIGTVPAG